MNPNQVLEWVGEDWKAVGVNVQEFVSAENVKNALLEIRSRLVQDLDPSNYAEYQKRIRLVDIGLTELNFNV